MTKALEDVIEKMSRLSPERQEEVARLLDRLVDLDPIDVGRLSEADWAEVDRRLAAPARYATDEQVDAFFRQTLG